MNTIKSLKEKKYYTTICLNFKIRDLLWSSVKNKNHKRLLGSKMADEVKSITVVKLELGIEMFQNIKGRKLCVFM